MFATGRRYRLFSVRGIPVYAGSSWLTVVALYVWLQFERLNNSFLEPEPALVIGLVGLSAILFFGGVLVHEAAHALVARGFDLPVTGITLVFWGGATETRSNAKGPLPEFLVSAAGPASTLLLAGILFVAGKEMEPGLAREIIRDLAGLNLLFAGLNALPGFPLDGGRMLLAVAWGVSRKRKTALRVAGWVGIAVGAAFGAWAFVQLRNGNVFGGFFFGYIAMVLIGTGRQMPDRIVLRDQLRTGRVADAMRPAPDQIPATMSLADANDRWLAVHPEQTFPVTDAGRLVGTISMGTAWRMGKKDPSRPVRDAMSPLTEMPLLAPEDRLDEAAEWLGGRQAFVVREGILLGELTPPDLDRWYRYRYEPGAAPPRPDA